jgi:hypothetical protein
MINDYHEWPLTGIAADSMLGYLAALGALRTASEAWKGVPVRMGWKPHGSSWSPVLALPCGQKDALLAAFQTVLTSRAGHPALVLDKDLKISMDRFSAFSAAQAEKWLQSEDQWGAAIAAAFGCGGVGNDEGNIEDTAFRTMSGAGHQHFLEFMNTLAKETTSAMIDEALFGPWRYRDPSPILRWDAEDDRRYALRWDEPSKDPVRTVRGANRLALEALPFFPVVPTGPSGAATTAFTGRRSIDTFVTWPVWRGFLDMDTTASLIASFPAAAHASSASYAAGVECMFRSQRITLGKYRNFTPGVAL